MKSENFDGPIKYYTAIKTIESQWTMMKRKSLSGATKTGESAMATGSVYGVFPLPVTKEMASRVADNARILTQDGN